MFQYKKGLLVVLSFFLMVTMGCNRSEKESRGFIEDSKIAVVTTIYPMYDFVTKIGGEQVEVINLVPAGIEPHDFELSTGDMVLLQSAELLVYNGAGMEHFMDKTLNALSDGDLVVCEAAKEIAPLVAEDGDMDPHTWLSIENAKLECREICTALSELDPEHTDYYQQNLEAYLTELDSLQDKYETQLSTCSKDIIVVAHEAFGYLCKEQNLRQEAIEGLLADSEPDSARMGEIIDICKEEKVTVIFFEELVSPKVAQTIAEETGASTMILNPIEGITSEQEAAGADYITLMEENLDALLTALK